jgi:putative DNA methylase
VNAYRKKLIEVALPLPEINDASAYDKMPGIGPHPKGIHHWWARLPLPTARAVLFASVVDDPSGHPERFPTEEAQNAERERLFDLLRQLMQKKMHEHPEVYAKARAEMLKHCNGKLPPVLDPFAGGGSIPLEANRLGFEAHASDLNPVAVLLNKCNLEIAPCWLDCPPVNPQSRRRIAGAQGWRGTYGLAEDVRYYGKLIRQRAQELIGHLYPKVRVPKEHGGGEADVVAWIWARTVASPNPAVRGAHVPLVRSFTLATEERKRVWVEPVVDKANRGIAFEVRSNGTQTVRGTVVRKGAKCLISDSPIPLSYIREEGQHGRLGVRLLAIVVEGNRRKTYLSPTPEQEAAANVSTPDGYPDTDLPEAALGFRIQKYGIRKHWQMFTLRQLTALITLSDLVRAIQTEVLRDARDACLSEDNAAHYAETIVTFLGLTVNRCIRFNNALAHWSPNNTKVMDIFGINALPMAWDFGEANILGNSVGGWSTCCEYVADCVEVLATSGYALGHATQENAAQSNSSSTGVVVSTDPPYYDNIGYAALSDFFYIWLRRTIGGLHKPLFDTVLAPKMSELTASPELFDGDKEQAKQHFEQGFRQAFTSLRDRMDQRYPLTVYYAFKQEDEEGGAADESQAEGNGVDLTTGWETLLEALVSSGFQITATWPVRASQQWRMRAMGANALASYIVLACRPRPKDAPQTGRREFIAELKRELPAALRHLQQGNVAPVDFAQATIGPGMAVFSRFSRVLASSGQSMTVRTALSLINQILSEVLTEQEGEFDADSRWAVAWFEQFGMDEGPFGVAETLSKAKNTSVAGMVEAGVVAARGGKVRLLGRDDLHADWDPATDERLTVWEVTQYLIRALEQHGERGAAELLKKVGGLGEVARDLAYRLYVICERKKWAQEALAYNSLVVAWPEITRLAREVSAERPRVRQPDLENL